ncbi:MAG: hypothetical protein JW939_01145 [Candidatus Thermoplasmatota archaeon]|nr:hypothetical protein [Candidatus Thermoplasmatota archaeon]
MTGSTEGVPAEVISHQLNPEEPNVDSSLNVTVEFNIFDEPLTYVTIQWCIVEAGGGGACGPMQDMSVDGTGRNYSIDYPVGTFFNATYEFHIYDNFNPIYYFDIHVAKSPSFMIINGTMDENTIHPNETITVRGDLMTDLGEPVEGAELNLSIPDLSIFALSTSGAAGVFSVDLMVPVSGYLIVNLTATHGELVGYRNFALTVSEWPLPNIAIQGTGSEFDDTDSPPGAPENVFYQGANVTFLFEVSNTGTDLASNISITLDLNNGSFVDTIEDSDLLPAQRYPGNIQLNTTETGTHTLLLSVNWDQVAPFPDDFRTPSLNLEYQVVPRPVWTGHTVFLEMFTQVTCAPCVYVEEALELLHEEGLNFEYVVYVTEDTESQYIAETKGVVTTPVLFVDGDLYRKNGSSNDLATEVELVRGLIEDAASLERAPVDLGFIEGEELVLTLYLDPQYREHLSGLVKVYRVESHSELRNNQSIPISNRYTGSVPGQEIRELGPGEWLNITFDDPLPGETYIAVVESDDGEVVGSILLPPGPPPEAYVAKDQALLRIGSPGQADLHLVVDRFQFEDTGFEDISLDISTSDLPDGWSVAIGGNPLSEQGTTVSFTRGSSSMELKPAGRVRYYQDNILTVSVPGNVSGNFNFDLTVGVGGWQYNVEVIVIILEPQMPEIEIVDVYLEGAGRTVYLYVKVKNITEGALVKAAVRPCDLGPEASCGPWEYFMLAPVEEGTYRTAIAGIDLLGFTHLTYHAWVEVDGTKYSETKDEEVEIASVIDVDEIDDDEGTQSIWLIVFSVLGVLVIIALALVLFIMARSNREKEPEIEEVMGEPLVEGGTTIDDGSDAPQDGIGSPEE